MKILPHTENCISCMHKSFLFTKMKDEELSYINDKREERSYEPGEIIIPEGGRISEFTYLKSGLIKMVKRGNNDKDRIISIARPRDFVSLISTFSDKNYQYSVCALEPSVVCSIELEAMKKVIRNNGDYALELLHQISHSTNSVLQHTYEIDDKQLRGRIAYILLWFAKKIYRKNKFTLPISRREMGELINMTTENVIRILSEFNKDNIVNIKVKEIEILNMDFLDRLSKSG